VLIWTAGTVVGLIGLWAGYTQVYEGNLGQPSYAVTHQQNGIEFRQYEPFVIASTAPEAAGNQGLRKGFRVLAGYIFGGNKPGESIAMTAPVLQQNTTGESLPMTAPVIQDPTSMHMAFVMPAGRSVEDLPTPNSAQVSLHDVDWGEVAAIRFAGRGKQTKFIDAEAALRDAIVSAGRTARGPAFYAQYNSPSAFPPMRRNEVLLPLEAQ